MAAQRCSLCGISYPTMTTFKTCPIHDEETDYLSNGDPDPDWKSHMERLLRDLERATNLAGSAPLAAGVEAYYDPATGPHVLFVDQDALFRSGVKINSVSDSFKMFTLDDGWIYETQGWDEPRRRWWVERVIRAEE